MKKTFFKGLVRGIKQNFGRFISIIAIVALGIGFLIGLLSTTPDLHYSISNYYKKYNVADVNLKSTVGFSKSAVDDIKDKYGNKIELIDAVTQIDQQVEINTQATPARVFYYTFNDYEDTRTNSLELIKGRYPDVKNECVVSEGNGYLLDTEIGAKVLIGDDTFEVVGIVRNPYYFSKQKEFTTIGNGQLGQIIYLDKYQFSIEEIDALPITDIYLTLEGIDRSNVFTKEYINKIETFCSRFDRFNKPLIEKRIVEIEDDVSKTVEVEVRKEAEPIIREKVTEAAEIEVRKTIDDLRKTLPFITDEFAEQLVLDLMASKSTQDKIEQNVKEQLDILVKEKVEEAISQMKLDADIYELGLNDSNTSYITFKMNAEKVSKLAIVFPLFFFLIAALITLTSITRMVEEERTSIGTLKALGYSKAVILSKYMLYALIACAIGSVLGIAFGIGLLPYILYSAYNTLYFLPPIYISYEWLYVSLSVLAMLATTLLVTFLVCHSTLKEKPSTLMLGKAPKPGKKILLEKVPFIWKHLKFKYKSMFKNIFRYKKNLFVMLLGIGGCTALLLTAFGLQDSLGVISSYQYDKIFKYDMILEVKDNKFSDDIFIDIPEVTDYTKAYVNSSVKCINEDDTISSYLIVNEDEGTNTLDKYVRFEDSRHNEIEYKTNEIYITEQIADYLHLSKGDTFVVNINNVEYNMTADNIVTNYVNNYIYCSEKLFSDITKKPAEFNSYLVSADMDDKEVQQSIFDRLSSKDSIRRIDLVYQTRSQYDLLFDSLIYIIIVLILFSGALSMVVTYNLTNININERIREIATLKVLGYQRYEVAGYIYRETMVQTIFGTLFGLLLGFGLHRFVISIIENEGLMLAHAINPLSYLYAFLFSILFAILVDILFLPVLRKVKMVESLKCVD